MAFVPKNYVDGVGPVVNSAWLNPIDYLANSVFGGATTNPAARTALCADLPLEIANGGTSARSASAAISALGGVPATSFTQAGIGALLYPATTWETAGSVAIVSQEYLPGNALRYASADGATDVTSALQAVLNALPSGGSLYFPAQSNYWKITSALTLPQGITLFIYGDGQGSQIYQATPGANVFTSLSTWAHPASHMKFLRLYLHANVGVYGIALNGNTRSSVKDCFFAGFTSSSTSAAVGVIDCIELEITGNSITSCYNGIYAVGSTNSAYNGGGITDNNIENCTGYGVLADYMNGLEIRNTIESCGLGGVNIYLGGGGLNISGYYEQNYTSGTAGTTEFADISIGLSSYLYGVNIAGAQFNGNGGTSRATNDYVPIRVKYAAGLNVGPNMLNTGSNFVNFESGSNVSQSSFGLIGFHDGAFDHTNSSTATYSAGTQAAPTALPSIFNWVTNGVTIEGVNRIVGTISQQFLRTADLPVQLAMWTVTGTNGGMTADGKGAYVDTTATASSTAVATIPSLGLSSGQGQGSIDFTKEVIATWTVSNVSAGTSTGASWLMLTGSVGAADPSTVSLGFKVINSALWGITDDGSTLNLVNLNTSLSAGVLTELKAVSLGGAEVLWYVNGAQVGTTTSNCPTGQNTGTLVLSAANGANAARQRLGLYDCKMSVSQ